MPPKKPSTPSPNSSVPGQYLGYSLQTTRLLSKLLDSAPGSLVALEVLEDVSVKSPDGTVHAEQVKSALDSNPVSDRAEGLWKALANWIANIKAGHFTTEKTLFEIYVSRSVTGKIVSLFNSATTLEAAKQALAAAKRDLWGDAPAFPLKAKVSDTIAPFVETVFDADVAITLPLIMNFSLTTGSGSPQDDLKEQLTKTLVPSEILDETAEFALGFVKSETDKLLEKSLPAVLSTDAVRKQLTAFVRKHDRRSVLSSFAQAPTPAEIETDLKFRTYVRQLRIIDCDFESTLRAVNDFLKAATDRVEWSVRGYIQDASLDEFADGLERTWDNLRRKGDIEHKTKPDMGKGMSLYLDCSSHVATLEGLSVPSHFTPGSFHALADTKRIGWHPNYKTELTKVADEDSK